MVRIEIDLSRYCIGKGREQQVELLSDEDFYSQEDYEELEKIEKWIRNLCKQFILLTILSVYIAFLIFKYDSFST